MIAAARAVRFGTAARTAFAAGNGRVIAVFARSLYVETDTGLACIGSRAIGDGPLNVLLDTAIDWRAAGIAPDAPVVRAGPALLLGRIALDLRPAALWRPPAILPRPWRSGRGDGLSQRLPQFAAQRRFGAAVRLAGRMLGIAAGGPADLLGLGPGLTPAGDDFLGGAMLAWRCRGDHARADRLTRLVLPLAATRTSRISRAHLHAAADGEGHAALHRVLSRRDAASLHALAAIGHTSGWDALAGAVAALAATAPPAVPQAARRRHSIRQ